MKHMNYWIMGDTHFGHRKLCEYSNRPNNFEKIILKNIKNTVKTHDVFIHVGDFCINKDEYWHNKFMSIGSFKKWLVKGNHDRKSNSWYLSHGWDFVSNSFNLTIYGYNILFSHIPIADNGYDINIHGHFHNNNHRKYEVEINNKHKLIMLEHEYTPKTLKTIVGG